MAASISSSSAARWIVPALALALCGLAIGASAAPAVPVVPDQVTVAFVHPEKFTDLQDRRFAEERVTEAYVADLRRFIEKRAADELGPDRKLDVTITDIDMAGEIEPNGFHGQDIRLLRESTPPRIALSFRLVDAAGHVIKSGDRHLTDLGYEQPETRSRDTSLYFEKKLLSDWLNDELRH